MGEIQTRELTQGTELPKENPGKDKAADSRAVSREQAPQRGATVQGRSWKLGHQ